jgi:hypothetical protein
MEMALGGRLLCTVLQRRAYVTEHSLPEADMID